MALMPLDQKAIIRQIDDILSRTDLRSPHQYEDLSDVPTHRVSEAVNLLLSAIYRLAPIDSVYARSAKAYEKYSGGYGGLAVQPLQGILTALRSDYESGYLQSVVELVHADIFADFLDMADYLLEQHYKDPAAVLAGSVLETHLRKLCDKHRIASVKAGGKPKTADALNSELAGASVYSTLELKSFTAWLDLRNKAAHGKYTEYDQDQVAMLIQGVRDFAIRNPA
jgi:hypothetical protein